MSTLLRSTLTAMVTTAALLSAPVFAATETVTPPTVVTANQDQKQNRVDRSEWINLKQAYEAVEKAGYKDADIHSINTTRDGYRVKLSNAENQKVRLMVHPTDGTVKVHEKSKNKRQGKCD